MYWFMTEIFVLSAEVEWWRDTVGAADDSASAMTSSEAKWLTSCSDDVIKLLSVQKSTASQSAAGIPFEAGIEFFLC
jgi:hypothetical protein